MNWIKRFQALLLLIVLVSPARANEPYVLPTFTQTSQQEWFNSRPMITRGLNVDP